MEGTVALVTGAGAGAGPGRAIALRFAREGAAVVAADVDVERAEETVRLIEADAGVGYPLSVDVTAEDEARGMFGLAEQRFGGLDVLVNNAGGAPGPHFPDAPSDHWGRTLDLNLRAVMLCTQLAVPAMRARGGGTIVNVSSMAGIGSRAYIAPEYAASKAAVNRLTTSLAHLKGDANVRVNCICPGWVETPAVRRASEAMTAEKLAAQSMPPPPVRIRPEQIADAVVTLVRDKTLAGQVMLRPGGEEPRLLPVEESP